MQWQRWQGPSSGNGEDPTEVTVRRQRPPPPCGLLEVTSIESSRSSVSRMRDLEKSYQSVGEEEERKKKKKKKRIMRVKEKMDEEGNVSVESSKAGLRDVVEVGLEPTSENNEKRGEKKKKKLRDVEASESIEGTTEREVDEGTVANDGKGEKMKKRKRRTDETSTGKQDGAPSATDEGKKKKKKPGDVEVNEGNEGTSEGAKLAVENHEKEEKIKKKKRRKDKASTGCEDNVPSAMDEGKQRLKAENRDQLVVELIELQETQERKTKDKIPRVGKNLESFEVGVLKSVSGNREGSGGKVRLEDHLVQHGDVESLKETKTKRKKRKHPNSEDTESFPEQHLTKEKKPIAEDGWIAEAGSSHGSHDGKRRKKSLAENSLGSDEINNKKKAKDKLPGHGDDHKMRSSSMTRDEKKTREKKKKNKDGTAEDMKVSTKGISNAEIDGENNKPRDARKRSNVSVGEGASSVRNVDATKASTSAESKKKVKKVNFSGHVEVFPSTGDAKSNDQLDEDGLIQGKRFSQEEDEMIRQAIFDYIEENQLGEDGLNMVLNCKSHPQTKGCWKEIGAALPWRRQQSIYWRAHTLFQRSESRKWQPEELDLVRRYYKEHGPKWKEMADLLGKHRVHVKDTWRRIKLTNAKKGYWSQDEYQALFDLVNVDLQLKAFEEKKSKHGMLRENISWGAISEKLSTRHDAACCEKWYMQLTSSMVAQGLWADTDDYRLIDELLKLDASCIEDVEWDNLLEHRSGDLCLKRWRQMARHIGGHRENSFVEQVDLLATRYCPKMLQYRTGNPKKCVDDVDGS